jgi:3-dehydroquinate synthase
VAPFVALIGFMGSGKSSVGKEVAAELGWRFVDLDEAFVEAEGVGIPDFFASHGEAAFRSREVLLLRTVLGQARDREGLVLALGGGTLESPCAGELLSDLGGIVYLDVEPAQAWSRVEGTGRPLAVDYGRFEELLTRRRTMYERVADWVLPVESHGVDELADEIVSLVRAFGDCWHRSWGRRLKATQRSSLIVGGAGALEILRQRSAAVLDQGSRIFVITDENVHAAWGTTVSELLGRAGREGVLVVPAGEKSKSLATLGRCWEWLSEQGARRDDVIVALGGGVIGDVAGFAAATYQRGITLWQVPTTLLAQVDSSVGGKTAIDLSTGKNMVGAFYQPDLVVTDPITLSTLSERDYIGGLGEVVKHALLLSPATVDRLESDAAKVVDRDPATLSWIVRLSVGFKAGVVEEDEHERGRRAVLNLGHTAGHALEVALGYGRISHGEAVALGLLVALRLSELVMGLDPGIRVRVEALLSSLRLPTTIELPAVDDLLVAAARDKKARAGSSGFVLLRTIGDPVWGVDVSRELLAEALEVIRR